MAVSDQVQARVATDVVRVSKGAAAQSGDLHQWQDSTGAVLSSVDSAGNFVPPTGGSPVLLSTVDAKGDLIVGTADNTVDNLTAGTDATRLVADSSTATGLRWEAHKYAETIGDTVATSFVINHALGTQDVHVQVREAAGTLLYVTPATIAATDADNVTVTFAVAPGTDEFRVIVQS